MNPTGDLLRGLPSIDQLIREQGADMLVGQYGRTLTLEALRHSVESVRARVIKESIPAPATQEILKQAARTLTVWLTPSLRRVINATGIIVHTNLGRAPLADSAIEAIQQVGQGYSTLEFDLDTGRRGSRTAHVESLLTRITQAEAALVVNNCASAVLLALTVLSPAALNGNKTEVVISRSQLIEIGGGFRMPDVMVQSGAHLIEVGTTNRTHLQDYQSAFSDRTSLVLHVHRSNFALVGFTSEPPLNELAAAAHNHGVPLIDDIGSGALLDTALFGLAPEPTVQASLEDGADLVMFSGDKLLGGPQAGILVGKASLIDKLKRHPLTRAVRADKLCLAALTATLTHYLRGEALTHIPVWQMIAASPDELHKLASRWLRSVRKLGLSGKVTQGQSMVGGGSLPGTSLPTALLALDLHSPDKAAAFLRHRDVPIVTRIEDDRLVIDPRTVLERDRKDLLAGLASLTYS